jgi:Ca-activated chloride channel family protein
MKARLMQADYIFDYPILAPDTSHQVHLMARFIAGETTQQTVRRPLNLSLIIDHSGSMAGQKLDFTRQAAQFLVQNLSAEDILSIVLYNDSVETLLYPENVLRKDTINQHINSITASGTTNLSGGWLQGCQHISTHYDTKFVNRAILMTDGLANRGVTDHQQLVKLATQKYGEGISTTTMGLGQDFNEDLLTDMANHGGGSFYFIESPEVAPTIFHEELNGLLNVVGQNLTLTITPAPHITLNQQLNAYTFESFNDSQRYRLGDIFAKEVKALLLSMSIPPLSNGTHQVATLKFEFDELLAESTEHRIIELPVTLTIGSHNAIVPHQEVQTQILLLQAAQARREAIISADKRQYQAGSILLKQVADALTAYENIDPRIAEEKRALLDQAKQLNANNYNAYSRKSMHTQAIYAMTNRYDETQHFRLREESKKDAQNEGIPSIAPNVGEPSRHPLHSASIHIDKSTGQPPTHVVWRDQVFVLSGDLIRIGRASENEITLEVRGISRFHCQIRREGDWLLLEDLGSTNGTMLGGTRLTEPHVLQVGDVVYISDEKLFFRDAPGNTVSFIIED